jgi:hypothetical protein
MPRRRTVVSGELIGGDKRRAKRRATASQTIASRIYHGNGRVYTAVWYDPSDDKFKLQIDITYEVGRTIWTEDIYFGVIDGTKFIQNRLREIENDPRHNRDMWHRSDTPGSKTE